MKLFQNKTESKWDALTKEYITSQKNYANKQMRKK